MGGYYGSEAVCNPNAQCIQQEDCANAYFPSESNLTIYTRPTNSYLN
jgi:hypothetical protein